MIKFFSSLFTREAKLSCKEFPKTQTDEAVKRRDDAIVETICSLNSNNSADLRLSECVTSDDLKRLKERILSCPFRE